MKKTCLDLDKLTRFSGVEGYSVGVVLRFVGFGPPDGDDWPLWGDLAGDCRAFTVRDSGTPILRFRPIYCERRNGSSRRH